MADRLLHTKQTKSKVFKHLLPTTIGNDADINISSITSKGTYLTAKAGGQWHSVKLHPPDKVDDGDYYIYVCKNIAAAAECVNDIIFDLPMDVTIVPPKGKDEKCDV